MIGTIAKIRKGILRNAVVQIIEERNLDKTKYIVCKFVKNKGRKKEGDKISLLLSDLVFF